MARGSRPTNAAVATAHCDIALLTEIADDLHRAPSRSRNLRDVFDCRQVAVVEPDLNDDAQRKSVRRVKRIVLRAARPFPM